MAATRQDEGGDGTDSDNTLLADLANTTQPPPPPRPSAPRPRARRDEEWGPFKIAVVTRAGVQIGWGATCAEHKNGAPGDLSDGTACKKQLQFGTVAPLSNAECRQRIKAWLLAGTSIPFQSADGRARFLHRDTDPRTLPLRTDVQLDAELAAWQAHGAVAAP